MKEFFKSKKNIGIISILTIVIIVSGVIYHQNGFKELRKNDDESIFVEENQEQTNSEDISNSNTNDVNEKVKAKEKTIIVEIKGEVNKPDVYKMDEDSIVKDLIDKAGGLTEEADLSNINRAKQLQSHEVIYINNKQEISQSIQVNNSINQNQSTPNDKVNINTASVEELKKLNGIGDSKAKSIIQYREENGSFKSIEDLKNVTGIGEKMFEKIKEQIAI